MKIALLIPDNRDEFRDYSGPAPRFGPAPAALLQGFERVSDCEIHVVSCLHRALPSPERIANNIFFHSIVVPRIGWRPSVYFGCTTAIRRLLHELKPDIVHGQGTERYCALAAALSRFPNVVTVHGNMLGMARITNAPIGSFYWIAAKLESFALKRTDGVFCNSAYTEELARQRTAKTLRVPNALREQFLKPAQDRQSTSKPVILNVGTIAPHKRQLEILALAAQLNRAGHQFEMQFVGRIDGDSYGRKFQEQIASAECADFARHIDVGNDDELVQLFDRAEALVHFPREEAFGLVVAEALARNLKFFGARVGGIPDIANGVELAELYEQNDLEALSRGMAHWLVGECPRPVSAGLEMKTRYQTETIAARHLEIYRKIL